MRFCFFILSISTAFLVGCASVPMASKSASMQAKEFNEPSPGKAGLYIYREGGVGSALKKDIWVDGKCIGESAPKVFFYEEVDGGIEHTISTESEFSPNAIEIITEKGVLYFIKQYIKMGVFVGGANLKFVDESEGKSAVKKLDLAKRGTCS